MYIKSVLVDLMSEILFVCQKIKKKKFKHHIIAATTNTFKSISLHKYLADYEKEI